MILGSFYIGGKLLKISHTLTIYAKKCTIKQKCQKNVNFLDDYERRIAELREQQAQVLDEYVEFVKEQQGKLDEASKAFNENLAKLEQQFDDGEITEAAYQR